MQRQDSLCDSMAYAKVNVNKSKALNGQRSEVQPEAQGKEEVES